MFFAHGFSSQELVDTERTYVQGLTEMWDGYLSPILKHTTGKGTGLTLNQSETISANLSSNTEALLEFQQDLLSALEASQGPDASVFIQRKPGFSTIYSGYLGRYDACSSAVQMLTRSRKLSKVWQDLSEVCRAEGRKPFQSLLISPVQRVPRYVLLLRELIKNTDNSDNNYKSLKVALAMMEDVGMEINESKRTVENRARAVELKTLVKELDPSFGQLSHKGRPLLREGVLMMHGSNRNMLRRTMKSKEYVFFLFSDALMWTNKEFKYKGHMHLYEVKMSQNKQQALLNDSKGVIINLVIKDDRTREEWFSEIARCISDAPPDPSDSPWMKEETDVRAGRRLLFASCCFVAFC